MSWTTSSTASRGVNGRGTEIRVHHDPTPGAGKGGAVRNPARLWRDPSRDVAQAKVLSAFGVQLAFYGVLHSVLGLQRFASPTPLTPEEKRIFAWRSALEIVWFCLV